MVWWNEKDDFCIYSLECCPHFYYEDRLTSWHGHPSVTLLVSIWYPKYHWPLAVTSAGLPTSSVWSPWPDCCTGQRRRPLWPARLWGALTWGWKSGTRYNILNGTKGQRGLTKYFANRNLNFRFLLKCFLPFLVESSSLGSTWVDFECVHIMCVEWSYSSRNAKKKIPKFVTPPS